MVNAMSKLPFMPLYIADYDAATSYLSAEEDGVYGRVLRMMWTTPNCSLPDDKEWLIKRLRLSDHQYETIFLFIKSEYFKVKKGRIYQKRLQEEYVKAKLIIKARSEAGKRGGRPKSQKINGKDKSKGSVLLKQNESKPKASTSTSTSTSTLTKKEPPIVPQGGKRKTQLPKSFIPSKQAAETYWQANGRGDLDYTDQSDKFITYCKANGTKYLDWQAGWKTWYCNAVKFNRKQVQKREVGFFDG